MYTLHSLIKMRIFQTVEKNFIHLGLYSNPSSPSLKVKNVFFLGIYTVGTAFACVPMYQSATLFDLTQSAYYVSSIALVGIQYAVMVYKIPYFYQLRNSYENIIDTSEFTQSHLPSRDFKQYAFIFI